jgi:hypothetical protein
MNKHIVIKNCDECPFFIPSWAENCKESCRKAFMKPVPIESETKVHEIPNWCDLIDYGEEVKCDKHELVFIRNVYESKTPKSEWKCSKCEKIKYKRYFKRI